jgi:hypothetical protein
MEQEIQIRNILRVFLFHLFFSSSFFLSFHLATCEFIMGRKGDRIEMPKKHERGKEKEKKKNGYNPETNEQPRFGDCIYYGDWGNIYIGIQFYLHLVFQLTSQS